MKPLNIVMIDDDKVQLLIASKVIKSLGVPVSVVDFAEPDKALEYLITAAGNDTLPDILFLDINMPVIDGWDLLDQFAAMKNVYPGKVKIYMLSSSINDQDIERARANPFISDFVSKPLHKQVMAGLLPESVHVSR